MTPRWLCLNALLSTSPGRVKPLSNCRAYCLEVSAGVDATPHSGERCGHRRCLNGRFVTGGSGPLLVVHMHWCVL